MMVNTDFSWEAAPFGDLRCGDLFTVPMRSADLLAMLADHDGGRFVLVLKHRGAHQDFERHPPPIGLSTGTVAGNMVLRFTGMADARPVGPGFPAMRSSPVHGALVIDAEKAPWIYCEEARSGLRFHTNLRTGVVGHPVVGSTHAEWELAVAADDDRKGGQVLATFGG